MTSKDGSQNGVSETENVRRRGDRRVHDVEVVDERRKSDRRDTPGLPALMRRLLQRDSSKES